MVTFTKAGLLNIMPDTKHGHHNFDKKGLNLLGVIV